MTATGSPAGGSPDVGDELAGTALALARWFSAGATMWCLSPAWPEHARHVAVEFVHPVVMGTRALPAVAVEGPDPVASLRSVVRAGDVLLAVSGRDEPAVCDALARAPAWGASTIWIGAGPRPPSGLADKVVWGDGEPGDAVHNGAPGDGASGDAVHDGRLVLLYHVLWELTHVCFEHTSLLALGAPCDEATCVTCSDEAVTAEVVQSDGSDAVVRTPSGLRRVDVSLVGPVAGDDLVLVHAGTAIARAGGAQ